MLCRADLRRIKAQRQRARLYIGKPPLIMRNFGPGVDASFKGAEALRAKRVKITLPQVKFLENGAKK
jgi:hypothetical protein